MEISASVVVEDQARKPIKNIDEGTASAVQVESQPADIQMETLEKADEQQASEHMELPSAQDQHYQSNTGLTFDGSLGVSESETK